MLLQKGKEVFRGLFSGCIGKLLESRWCFGERSAAAVVLDDEVDVCSSAERRPRASSGNKAVVRRSRRQTHHCSPRQLTLDALSPTGPTPHAVVTMFSSTEGINVFERFLSLVAWATWVATWNPRPEGAGVISSALRPGVPLISTFSCTFPFGSCGPRRLLLSRRRTTALATSFDGELLLLQSVRSLPALSFCTSSFLPSRFSSRSSFRKAPTRTSRANLLIDPTFNLDVPHSSGFIGPSSKLSPRCHVGASSTTKSGFTRETNLPKR